MESSTNTQRIETNSFQRRGGLVGADQDALVHSACGAEVPLPEQKLIHELFEEQVKRTPHATAVTYAVESLTYNQLNARANQLARYLRSHGVGPDQLVGICVERSLEMVVGLLGTLKAGGAYVPLDPNYPAERLRYVLNDAAPRVLLTQERFRSLVEPIGDQVLALDSNWEEIAGGESGNLQRHGVQVSSRALAYVIYTSGSTGKPKGAMNEHRGVVNRLLWMQSQYGLSPRDSVLQKTPISFDVSVWEFFWTLMSGARLVMARPQGHQDPRYIREIIERAEITTLHFVPSMLQVFLEQREYGWCRSLRHIVCSGEELSKRLQDRCLSHLPQARLSNLYGPTEAAVDVTFWGCQVEEQGRSVPIGRPIWNTQIHLLDAYGRPVQAGAAGEIHIGGMNVGRGYLNRPELTAERFTSDAFSGRAGARLYKTGDMGRRRPDGAIEYLGRNDHQVKIGGVRIELGEIEAQLVRHELVKEVVVCAREDVTGEPRLVAYVVVNQQRLKEVVHGPSVGDVGDVISQWRELYEDTYAQGSAAPSFVGWNSSYTGTPIPEEQMRAWLSTTLTRIGSLQPRRIVEIGTGVGLLLRRLAPDCESYRGSDLSGEAISRLRHWVGGQPGLQHVQLQNCAALEVSETEFDGCDTVILNSVVQYFPDIGYLLEVLRRVVSRIRPGGHVFIGDVRHLGLLPAFHSAVQLARASDDVSVSSLKEAVSRSVRMEKELVIDPIFFAALAEELPCVAEARILLKRSPFDNELTRYRYDVILKVGERAPIIDFDEVDWTPEVSWSDGLREKLCRVGGRPLRVRGVKNRWLCRDLETARLIADTADPRTASELRESVDQLGPYGEDPEMFWKLADTGEFEVSVSWTPGSGDGSYDVEIANTLRVAVQADGRGSTDSGQVVSLRSRRVEEFANDPLALERLNSLTSALRRLLAANLPSAMIPSAFVALDELPLMPNGKLDRRALPAPDSLATVSERYDAPQGETEELLASIWQDLFRIDKVGRWDNFFELGGHSLLIVRMMERLRRAGVTAEARRVYGTPRLADMAQRLLEEGAVREETPPNRVPVECDFVTPEMLSLVELDQQDIDRVIETVPGGASNVQDIYPLAPLQEGMLFHHLLGEHQADVYVLPTLLMLDSQDHLEELVAALQEVIDRHDVLRTAIVWESLPRPLQVVYRRATLPVEEMRLDHDRDLSEQLSEQMQPQHQRIELRSAPLMRLRVTTDRVSRRCYALLQLHHLVCDKNSLDAMLEEVAACLGGRSECLMKPLAYRSHVARVISGQHQASSEAFFRNALLGVAEPTAPFGIFDVYGDGSRVVRAGEPLNSDLAKRVRVQARRLGISVATLFHVAWALVVSRTSGREDLVYGTVLSGRMAGSSGGQLMLGMFINTLPLRIKIREVSTEQLVMCVQRDLGKLLSHEQASLAVAQRASELPVGTPLFAAVLNYRPNAVDLEREFLKTKGVSVVEARNWTNYPFVLSVDDLGDEFFLVMDCDRRVSPQRMLAYMHTATHSVAVALEENPLELANALTVLPRPELQSVLQGFNGDYREYPCEKLIHELFEEQVERTPEAVAVSYEGEWLTYGQLNARANQLARYLRSHGVGPDQLVGICVERSLEMVVGLLGTLKAGGAYVPLDPNYPTERLRYLLKDAAPRVLLIQERLRDLVEPMGGQVLALDSNWGEIADRGSDNLQREVQINSQNLAYVIYTSGSTGEPKGVMIEHRNVTRLFAATAKWFDFNERDVWTLFHSFAFDFSVWELWGGLFYGGRVVVVPYLMARAPQEFYRLLCEEGVTVLNQTPSAFTQLIDAQGHSAQRHALRAVIFGGEALDLSTLRPWMDRNGAGRPKLVNMYGITETTVHVTYRLLKEEEIRSERGSLIGAPIPDLRAYLLDRHRQPVPIGVAGEIYVGGAGVARGYLNRPGLTTERFVADPFSVAGTDRMYKTGDLGRWRADGTLEYLGRNDQQVKIRGFRIELGEIEARLAQHEQVKDAVVLVREDVPGEKRLVAYITRREGSVDAVSAESLRSYLKTTLPEYMVPSAIVVLDRLPLTTHGKLDRQGLPAPDLGAYVSGAYGPPEGEVEEILARIWRELLRLERVGRHDNFFELGGHSVLAMQLLVRIQAALSVECRISVLFESPTLEQMSARVSGLRDHRLLQGGSEMEGLLSDVASMPESKVQELLRRLTTEGMS